MSESISYNTEILDNLLGNFSTFKSQVSTANQNINEQINIINTNWSGAEHDAAKIDLDNIQSNMQSLEASINEIYKLLNDVNEGFKKAKY